MRRLLGPVGGPFMFFLFAALVFAGLGWVTVAALRVEEAQREAAAQAVLGNNLRVAVRQLDTRMLSTLTIEDSRPFYHYNSADPVFGSTAGPTPLLAAPFPDWMKLHVQIDPIAWESPQVLSPEAARRVAIAWPELPQRNNTSDRAALLLAMRQKYPAPSVCELLAARERAAPADPRPFVAPWIDPLTPAESVSLAPPDSVPKPPPPPEMGPTPAPSTGSFRVFGWELARRDAVADARGAGQGNAAQNAGENPHVAQAPKPPAFPPNAAPPGGAVGRNNYPLTENERQLFELRSRYGSIARGLQEAKNAGQDFSQFNRNFPNFPQNTAGPDTRNQTPDKDKSGAIDAILKKEAKERVQDVLKHLHHAEQLRGSLFDRLATVSQDLDRRSLEEIENALNNPWRPTARPNDLAVAVAWSFRVALAVTGGEPVPGPRPVPPAEDRPAPAARLAGPPVVNIHLGSLRPQWITAADGTETLLLVRVAKIDNQTVYQGVVVDWPKLERMLRDEVKEQFPDAKIVPVRDPASIVPDRAMTALPVQLDLGPAAPLPPAGWTPLRIGLVLAWVAALVAFAAVGFSGWTLIDLAERRIRFVSAVTHELRTPLTSLRLYLDLLMSGMIHDEAKRQEYLSTLALESDRLHRLIDNVLDFAKLEKRAKNGDMKPVKVGDLVEQLRNTWTDRVAADGKELLVISTLPAEMELCTDPVMVHQIVGNLIDNARKYTRDADDKRIWLWAKPGGDGRIVFEVEDRGPGVPQSERKSIFKPFRRGAQADAKAGGAGLGLALAKQWAEVLGGTVAYRPADGAPGACFRLELPLKG